MLISLRLQKLIQNHQNNMIQAIWDKSIIAIVSMNSQDIADTHTPLPLILDLSWNAYIGFYYDIIFEFFQIYAPFPIRRTEFHLTCEGNHHLDPTEIVYHILEKHKVSLTAPLQLTCHFRRRTEQPQVDLRRHYKNNLKASTALRYGKYGASILTVEMSVSNFQNLITSFRNGNYQKFLGSSDFQSDDLGYLFLIHRGEKIAVKFVGQGVTVERSAEKELSFQEFVCTVFGEQIVGKLKFRIHLLHLETPTIKIRELQQYSHPDGYLYIHI